MTSRTLITHAVDYWARVDPERTLLSWVGDSVEAPRDYTAAELAHRVEAMMIRLREVGVIAGDVCAVHTGNRPSFVVALLALLKLGAVAVPTIVQAAPEELAYILGHSGAKCVITTQHLAPLARSVLPESARILIEEEIPELSGDYTFRPGCLSAREAPAQPGKLLMYSSGSSGRPKGVLLTEDALHFTALTYAEHLRLTSADRVLICMPLFHINGLVLQLSSSLIAGARVVLAAKFSVSGYWRWCREYGATIAHLVSGPVRLLLQQAKSLQDHGNTLRLMTFGLPLEREEIIAMEERFGLQMLMVWGLTETCCGGTLMGLDHLRRNEYQNVGVILRGWTVLTCDEDGRLLPPGTTGELWVSSPGVMTEYWQDPKATAEALIDGGVRTGDLGYVDEWGYVHFVSRKKDMMKPNGENVAAEEVRSVLKMIAELEDCAVFSVPDIVRMERIIAVVEPAKGFHLEADELLKHCRATMTSFKVPSEILVIDELPRTSIGKIRTGDIRTEYLAGRRAPV